MENVNNDKKLLLLSNSTLKGESYLGWPQEYLQKFIQSVNNVIFIPFAGVTISYDDYTAAVQDAFGFGVRVTGIHSVENKKEAIKKADCIAVGGGNTFRLLEQMQAYDLLDPITNAVNRGVPYIGWSAGSNVACPSIMTTNDMPIVAPEGFSALNLTSFQINAHFTNMVIEGHGGESRSQRLEEFQVLNPEIKVVGLPEGKLLQLEKGKWYLKGIETEPTYLFGKGHSPKILEKGLLQEI